jgi:hypothetical protein
MMIKNKSLFSPLLPILVCMILVVVVYYPVFFFGYWAINRSDALNIHLPNNYALVENFRSGKLPLWNANFNLGQPSIDGFTMIFHFGLIFYLMFEPGLANTIEILFGLLLACLGIWYLLRQQEFELFPSIIGTFAYILAGPVFFLHSYHLDFMAILLLPWMLYIFHQNDRTNRSIWLWLAAILCTVAVQSVEPDTLFYLYIGLIIDRLVCLPLLRRGFYLIKWLGVLFLSGMTTLLYLPLYEWLIYSTRAEKVYSGLLSPNFLDMFTAMFANSWLTRRPYDYSYFYFGPALLWLVLAGLVKFNKTSYVFRYFLYSLAIPAFYITMRFLQVYYHNLLSSLDIWRSMFVFCLGSAMVAAVGVRNILKWQRIQRWLALLICLITITLAVWTISHRMFVFKKCLALLFASSGFLITILPLPKRATIFRFLGISIAVLSTLVFSAIMHTTEKRFCVISPNSREIKKLSFYDSIAKIPDTGEGRFRVSLFGITDNTTSLAGLKTLPNYTNIYNKGMEDALCSDGLISRYNKLPYWMQLKNPDAFALSLYGVRFLVTLDSLVSEKINKGWIERPDFSWFLYRVWENSFYVGRAYLVNSAGDRRKGVEFIEDKPVSVVMRTQAQDGDRLVLADLNYPGWQAQVDGKNVPTEVYHGCLRSVKLSKGAHIVSWKYNGRFQHLALNLSIIALCLLIIFLIILSITRESHKHVKYGNS